MSADDRREEALKAVQGVRADIRVRRGEFALGVAFDVPAGSVLGILGPNGSGKSTALGALSGLLCPDRGTVTLAGRTLTDVAARVHLPPDARRVGMLAQDALLFPHLSALDNVAFAPRSRGAGRAGSREVARRWACRPARGLVSTRTHPPPGHRTATRRSASVGRGRASRRRQVTCALLVPSHPASRS